MSQATYQIDIRWLHHKWGPQTHKLKQTATSIRRAINHGLQSFFTQQLETARRTKKREHLDAHKHLRVEAWRL